MVAPEEVIAVALPVVMEVAVTTGGAIAAATAALKVHQLGELSRLPVSVAPNVSRFGKSVVVAAHQTCCPDVNPDTEVLLIFKYKLYSLAAPLAEGVLATSPVVLPADGAVVVMALLTVMDKDCMALLLRLSVNWQVTGEALQDVDGVPEITPLVLKVKPAGNVPEAIDQVYGAVPPVAVNFWE